jgi:hypothetical protein
VIARLRTNITRLQAPDFGLVNVLGLVKALFEVGWFLIKQPSSQALRMAWLIFQVKPAYTMVSATRLINLYQRVQDANRLNLAGDIVECGVWHGGSSAMMGAAVQDDSAFIGKRRLWLFDSFQGLPPPGSHDGEKERAFYFEGWCKGDIDKIEQIFRRLHIPWEQATVIPGWFDVTLERAPIEQIAVLHVDADWYDSVKLVLDKLYDRVVPGGFIVIDDYWVWPGCKKAVGDFLQERLLADTPLHNVSKVAVYFQKTTS